MKEDDILCVVSREESRGQDERGRVELASERRMAGVYGERAECGNKNELIEETEEK